MGKGFGFRGVWTERGDPGFAAEVFTEDTADRGDGQAGVGGEFPLRLLGAHAGEVAQDMERDRLGLEAGLLAGH
jgi:hypothetical protein